MKYFINRQPIPGISDEELDKAFEAILTWIPEEWLNKGNSHPIKTLWHRKDVLASNELFSLGTAINELTSIDTPWLRQQVKQVKSVERNSHLGAIAEILSISLLNNEKHPTEPARQNQAGFDALMSIAVEKQIRISIKNYGQSKHEEAIVKWAAKTEELVKELLKKHDYYPATIFIDCPTQYPSEEKWKLLHSKLDEIFINQKNAEEKFTAICTNVPEWIVIISPHIVTDQELHPDFKSYSFVLSSVYHPNENENLLSKIQSACDNLVRHSAIENNEIKNFLFIHLSPLASIIRCKEWLDDYFAEFPNKPISAVIFHQPSVVTNLDTGVSHIDQYFFLYLRQERIKNWLPSDFTFILSPAIGKSSTAPANYVLNFEYPGGRKQQISVNDRYMYQRGNYYVKMKLNGKGYYGSMNSIVPGVFTHVVLEFPGQPEKAAIGPRFPPSDELLIL